MKRLLFVVCALALSLCAYAQTADEIVAKHLKALGGVEKLKALQSLRSTGKLKMGPMEATMVAIKARPNQSRMDFTIQGMSGTQAFDGSTGWTIMPGQKNAEAMPEEMAADARESSDFDGPLVDYKTKGTKIELAGKEDVKGSPAYKLHLTSKNGSEFNLYIDARTYLLVKSDDAKSESFIGDYKEVAGVLMAHSIEMHVKGEEAGQMVIIEHVDVNPKVDAATFKMPK